MFKRIGLICMGILGLVAGFAQGQHRITLNPALRPFYHGVESGDPTEDHVIIWTRVTPDTGATGNIAVYWQVATDTGFTHIVNYGKTIATEEGHYCAKVDVCGLQPSQFYYYMFNALGKNSIVGRTKTAPSGTADNDSVRFAVVSCAAWEHGYFNAYQSIANRNDVDAVVHLGDYIYEYASGESSTNIPGRTYDPPAECVTELGYELRYSQYKLDDQLRRVHQLFPFIAVWDDHETANDSWSEGAQNHTPATEGPFDERKNNSTSTYFKWMPVRKPDAADTLRIFRKLRYGKLLDLVMLDTRLYDRDEQDLASRDDSARHIMGPAERAWFYQQLDDTTTRWKIIGNQVMFAPLQVFGQPINADQWDGYNYERALIENHILNTPVKNVVILTGDIHTSWCNDIPGPNYNSSTGAGSVCVEFVGTSVTSRNSPLPVGVSVIKSLNPHMKYINLDEHGYYELDVKKGKTQADYTFVSTVDQLGATDMAGASYYVNNNQRNLNEANLPVFAPAISAPIPSLLPNQHLPFNKIENHAVVISENTQAVVNIIPDAHVCPSLTLNVASAQHGAGLSLNGQDVTYVPVTNYNGYDTLSLIVCTNENLPVCDTVYVFVTILSVQDIDTITVNIDRDSVYTACISFDDIQFTGAAHGNVTLTDSCFTYQPDSAYGGLDVVTFTACDTNGDCDTVVYVFRVDHPVTASVIDLYLDKNTNITECLVFDDLTSEPQTIQVILTPHHGTYQWVGGDSCVKYSPYFNYIGNDTMRFLACDTSGVNHCDTITIIYHINEPTAINEPNNMVVFGMYPNPVNDKLIIQYYLYTAEVVNMNVYDLNGRMVSTGQISSSTNGLHHAQLNTVELAAGTYIVELKSGSFAYRKQIIKR